jgi:hypothetical protein
MNLALSPAYEAEFTMPELRVQLPDIVTDAAATGGREVASVNSVQAPPALESGAVSAGSGVDASGVFVTTATVRDLNLLGGLLTAREIEATCTGTAAGVSVQTRFDDAQIEGTPIGASASGPLSSGQVTGFTGHTQVPDTGGSGSATTLRISFTGDLTQPIPAFGDLDNPQFEPPPTIGPLDRTPQVFAALSAALGTLREQINAVGGLSSVLLIPAFDGMTVSQMLYWIDRTIRGTEASAVPIPVTVSGDLVAAEVECVQRVVPGPSPSPTSMVPSEGPASQAPTSAPATADATADISTPTPATPTLTPAGLTSIPAEPSPMPTVAVSVLPTAQAGTLPRSGVLDGRAWLLSGLAALGAGVLAIGASRWRAPRHAKADSVVGRHRS